MTEWLGFRKKDALPTPAYRKNYLAVPVKDCVPVVPVAELEKFCKEKQLGLSDKRLGYHDVVLVNDLLSWLQRFPVGEKKGARKE